MYFLNPTGGGDGPGPGPDGHHNGVIVPGKSDGGPMLRSHHHVPALMSMVSTVIAMAAVAQL